MVNPTWFYSSTVTVDASSSDHPNKVPFSGVLCRLDEPTDNPPCNSWGMAKQIVIPTKVAVKAMASLNGMGINVAEEFDGHNRKKKIGVMAASAVQGGDSRDLGVQGHLFGKDFPDDVQFIKDNKAILGMSYEAEIEFENPWAAVLVAKDVTFTGATIMRKDLAACTKTSVAAQAQLKEDNSMSLTPEQALLLTNVATGIGTLTQEMTTLKSTVEAQGQKIAGLTPAVVTPAAVVTPGVVTTPGATVDAAAVTAGFATLAEALGKLTPAAAVVDAAALTPAQIAAKAAADQAAATAAAQAIVDAAAASSPAPKKLTVEAAGYFAKYGETAGDGHGKVSSVKLSEVLRTKGMPSSDIIDVKNSLKQAGMLVN